MSRTLVLLLALAAGGSVAAQSRVVGSRLFVEQPSAGGVRLAPAPDRLARGRSVVVLVDPSTPGSGSSGGSFTMVSAVPAALRFVRAEGRAELSVDGGRRFGALSSLTSANGTRRAQPADVTHLRWRIAPGARPSVLSFRGTVR